MFDSGIEGIYMYYIYKGWKYTMPILPIALLLGAKGLISVFEILDSSQYGQFT